MTKLALLLLLPLIMPRSLPRRALLLRRAVRVEVVELAAGEHAVVGPLAVLFLHGPLNTQRLRSLRRRAGLPFRRRLAFFRPRRSCLERLARMLCRLRRISDEVRDICWRNAERPRRVALRFEPPPRPVADSSHLDGLLWTQVKPQLLTKCGTGLKLLVNPGDAACKRIFWMRPNDYRIRRRDWRD